MLTWRNRATFCGERERHIALLRDELARKTEWLEKMESAHAALHREHEAVVAELGEHNLWAARLNEQLGRSGARVVELQDEIGAAREGYEIQIAELERQAAGRLDWVHGLEAQIAKGAGEIERLNQEIGDTNFELEERTRWAHSLNHELDRTRNEFEKVRTELDAAREELSAARAEAARLDAVLAAAEGSKWLRLGAGGACGSRSPRQQVDEDISAALSARSAAADTGSVSAADRRGGDGDRRSGMGGCGTPAQRCGRGCRRGAPLRW